MKENGQDVEQLMEDVNRSLAAPEVLLKDLWRRDGGLAPNLSFIYPPLSKTLEANLDRVSRNWEIDGEFAIGSKRTGLAPLVVALKRVIRSMLRWYANPVIHQERKFNMLVTQTLHDIANNLQALEERVSALERSVRDPENRGVVPRDDGEDGGPHGS